MASAQELKKLVANQKVDAIPSGDISTEGVVKWYDLSLFDRFAVIPMASALTGTGLTIFEIEASANADGSGTNATIKVHALASAPDAVGDYVVLEVSAEEVRGEATTATGALRYVGANVKADNAADNITLVNILSAPTFATDGLTADNIS